MHVRSSLVTRGSALPDACQLRPDIALTEPEQLNNLIQLSRGSFAASVWGRTENHCTPGNPAFAGISNSLAMAGTRWKQDETAQHTSYRFVRGQDSRSLLSTVLA